MDYTRDRTKTPCRGKWKEHGEIELTGSGNDAGTCYWIFKSCKRCHRNIFARWISDRTEFDKVWREERRKELGL